MHPSILAEIEQLPNCTVAQLRDCYEQVFGEPTGSRHRTYLARHIAWNGYIFFGLKKRQPSKKQEGCS